MICIYMQLRQLMLKHNKCPHFLRCYHKILIQFYEDIDYNGTCMTAKNTKTSEMNLENQPAKKLVYILNAYIEDLRDMHSH